MINLHGLFCGGYERETDAHRIGRRIRAIRKEKGISQKELGDAIGLTADRIQKYENGAQKPRWNVCEQIAEALGVEPRVLSDPVLSNYIGAMHALFELETFFNLKLKKIDGQICLYFGEGWQDMRVGMLNKCLELWYEEREKMEKAYLNVSPGGSFEVEEKRALSEYNMWEWNFPSSALEGG